jgi:hypothetical protein
MNEQEEEFHVEYVYGKRIENEIAEYLVKWANYGKSHASWEPFSTLEVNNLSALSRFEESQFYSLCYSHIQSSKKEGRIVHIAPRKTHVLSNKKLPFKDD